MASSSSSLTRAERVQEQLKKLKDEKKEKEKVVPADAMASSSSSRIKERFEESMVELKKNLKVNDTEKLAKMKLIDEVLINLSNFTFQHIDYDID
jgi:K+-transporting ATPase c subunit